MMNSFVIFVVCVLGQSLSSAQVNSYNQFSDMTVGSNGITIQCDRINCPTDAYRCEIHKIKLDPNAAWVDRRNICYAINGRVLRMKTTRELSAPGQIEQLNLIITKDGTITSMPMTSVTYNGLSAGVPETFGTNLGTIGNGLGNVYTNGYGNSYGGVPVAMGGNTNGYIAGPPNSVPPGGVNSFSVTSANNANGEGILNPLNPTSSRAYASTASLSNRNRFGSRSQSSQ